MVKRVKVEVKYSNRTIYTLILIGILIVGGLAVLAYGTSNPSTFGHSVGELAPPVGCTSGQVLSWDGSSWVCASVTGGGGGMVLGNWETKLTNTVYQAATDGFVIASNGAGGTSIIGYVDSYNPPTTMRMYDTGASAGEEAGITIPVKKGDYWKVVESDTIYWIPIISGGGYFTPIIPVTFTPSPTPTGIWTAVDLSSAIPAGTTEVGGSIRYNSPGGMGLVSIASKSDGTGEKKVILFADVPNYNIAMPFRLSLSEDRKLYYRTDAAAPINSLEIGISEYK